LRVAVIGGGIAGLAAGWELRNRAEVTLFEPERVGGKILTSDFQGRNVDCGPDAFITRVPDAVRLCAEVGVSDLVAPTAGRTLIWWRGRLRPLPDGLVLGAPRRLGPLVGSGLLSPGGLVRAAGDLVLSRQSWGSDVSVRDLVSSRFGGEVADRLVDPLVGGIHAGHTDDLSAATTVPQLLEAARRSRSLLLGLRKLGGARGGDPTFLAPREGMAGLVRGLVDGLVTAGTSICGLGIESINRDGRRWRLEPPGNAFDSVVLATESSVAARILGPGGPEDLSRIGRASVVLVTLGYSGLEGPSGVNGFLVPASAGLLMTACSFGSAKWPHWASPGRTVFRVSAGRDRDRRAMALGDDKLVDRLSGEVAAALATPQMPSEWRVSRWPDSFPQYRVGHGALVSRIADGLRRDFPGVTVCGASYHGAGIPACIASGRRAAGLALEAATVLAED
jgi:protoporphyrinogen/coproporphyrinogen III oxidase